MEKQADQKNENNSTVCSPVDSSYPTYVSLKNRFLLKRGVFKKSVSKIEPISVIKLLEQNKHLLTETDILALKQIIGISENEVIMQVSKEGLKDFKKALSNIANSNNEG